MAALLSSHVVLMNMEFMSDLVHVILAFMFVDFM